MRAHGVVSSWNDYEGWGVLESSETPGGCWVHYSELDRSLDRRLDLGQAVTFDYVEVDQDGFRWRAERVVPDGSDTSFAPQPTRQDGQSFSSKLNLDLD
jgi:cold shock protein